MKIIDHIKAALFFLLHLYERKRVKANEVSRASFVDLFIDTIPLGFLQDSCCCLLTLLLTLLDYVF